MRVFLYEYITGGGLHGSDDALLRSLEAEGRAMLSAVVHDLVSIDGIEVAITRDARLTDFLLPDCLTIDVRSAGEEIIAIDRLTRDADVTLIIAPEIDGALLQLAKRVESAGGQLISPDSDFIAVAADKMATNRCLKTAGVRVPDSARLEVAEDGVTNLPSNFGYPAIVKRVDGAGSLGVQLCDQPTQLSLDGDKPWTIEHHCAGMSASVAVLSGPIGRFALPPFRQRFVKGSFLYVGGTRITDHQRSVRAQSLAARAVRSIGQTNGWVGVDLILGEATDGSEDVVIEVNPRLTTSYIGLRAIAGSNLAKAMLDVATGHAPSLSFGDEPIEFTVEDGG